jgi:hypothetical protein
MMFAGISKRWRTLIVTIGGPIDATVYCNDCIDDTGPIPDMIAGCGDDWFLVQDGATCQMLKETMGYLSEYATVPLNWPSRSPDLNPFENL